MGRTHTRPTTRPNTLLNCCQTTLCERCKQELWWRLQDLVELAVHTREQVAPTGKISHATEHINTSTQASEPLNLDALHTSDKLIKFVQAWTIELSYSVNRVPLHSAEKFKLKTNTSAGMIEACLNAWIDWIRAHEEQLAGKLKTLFDELMILVEKTSARYPLEARSKPQQPRYCPICTKESAVVASWPQNQAPRVSCVFCGWNYDIDWSTINA